MDLSISLDTILPMDSPRKTSAFTIASLSVAQSVSTAYLLFISSRSFLEVEITPLLSSIRMFFGFTPKMQYKFTHEIAAAPAPLTTTLTSSIFFPANSSALSRAALVMIAVPCWSSCIIGISNSAFNLRSISKASGDLISSRLIPPKVGAIALTVLTNKSISFASTSISNTSISAKILKSKPLPSITGFDASGPMFPNPRTAVPFEITATRFPFAVYLYTSSGFSAILRHGSATPGE